MTILAAVGQSNAIDSRQAASEAAHQALDQLGRSPIVAGFVFATHDHLAPEIVASVSSLLGNIPLFGVATSSPLTSTGQSERSVIVALLSGTEIHAYASWSGGATQGKSSDDPALPLQTILDLFHPEASGGLFLVAGDGLSGKSERIGELLSTSLKMISDTDRAKKPVSISGCLSEADLFEGRTFQIGGQQSGNGGVTGMLISGKLAVGVGAAHGWRPVGKYFHITRSSGPWIRTLENLPATEIYSQLFGHSPREWSYPPLNALVRLYPFGIEQKISGDENQWLVRSAIRTETDGSLRMNTFVPLGGVAHLLVGSEPGCREAAQFATHQALASYRTQSSIQPSLALLFVDSAWRLLLQSHPGEEARLVSETLGGRVPVAGCYTWGQIGPGKNTSGIEVLNQHLMVVLLGERTI